MKLFQKNTKASWQIFQTWNISNAISKIPWFGSKCLRNFTSLYDFEGVWYIKWRAFVVPFYEVFCFELKYLLAKTYADKLQKLCCLSIIQIQWIPKQPKNDP